MPAPPKYHPTWQGEISSYNPSLREKMVYALQGGLGLSDDREGVRKARMLANALEMTPFGLATGLEDVQQAAGRGDYLGAGINLAMAGLPGPPINKGIRAFHGSPHDFDKFDLSKIGTGEGAQAYGHGLYFAENENVARDYRNTLAKGFEYQGQPVHRQSSLGAALDFLTSGAKSNEPFEDLLPRRIKELREHAEFTRKDPYMGPGENMYDRAANELAKVDPKQLKRGGKMYEVEINADPEQFLDWDKPLSEQGKHIQDALVTPEVSNLRARFLQTISAKDALARERHPVTNAILDEKRWHELAHEAEILQDQLDKVVTPDLPGQLAYYRTNNRSLNDPKGAARLREAGIPGIKYLDQGSRATSGGQILGVEKSGDGYVAKVKVANRGGVGFQSPTDMVTTSKPYKTEQEARKWAESQVNTGSRNYVVFDDKLLDIKRKYGISGLFAAMGLAGAAGYSDDAQAGTPQAQGGW